MTTVRGTELGYFFGVSTGGGVVVEVEHFVEEANVVVGNGGGGLATGGVLVGEIVGIGMLVENFDLQDLGIFVEQGKLAAGFLGPLPLVEETIVSEGIRGKLNGRFHGVSS